MYKANEGFDRSQLGHAQSLTTASSKQKRKGLTQFYMRHPLKTDLASLTTTGSLVYVQYLVKVSSTNTTSRSLENAPGFTRVAFWIINYTY